MSFEMNFYFTLRLRMIERLEKQAWQELTPRSLLPYAEVLCYYSFNLRINEFSISFVLTLVRTYNTPGRLNTRLPRVNTPYRVNPFHTGNFPTPSE